MQSNTIICNRDKFSLYSHFYKSMGFQVTFINGYFGNKGVLRVFTFQNFCKYYDNEIYNISLGLKENILWAIFECQKDCSPIFKIDIVKNGVNRIYEAINLSSGMDDETDSVATALPFSNYFCFRNSARIKANKFEDWDWWTDAVICEYKDVVANKISYQILHLDELDLIKTENTDFTLSQYDFVQQFKRPITYFRKRKHITNCYNNIEWKSYFWNSATGIGVLSGANSYRCIDIDGCSSTEFVKQVLLSLGIKGIYDWVISTGSNNGFHVWIKVEELPSNLLMNSHAEKLFKNAGFIVFEPNEKYKNVFKRIELRWKCHVIMPPSLSGYGFNYNFIGGLPQNVPQTISSSVLLSSLQEFGYNTALNYEEIIHCKVTNIGPSVRRYDLYQTVILVLDIETTGLAQDLNVSFDNIDNWPYVVQISYQIFSGYDNDILKESDYILKPDCFTIPDASVSIHGITNDRAQEEGWDRRDFYRYFVEQLKAVHYIVVHNADFDINVLKCELLRYTELSKDDINLLFYGICIICTMKATVDVCKIESNMADRKYKYPSLKELYNYLFHKDFDNMHNSLYDVRATAECFWELSQRGIIKYCKNSPIQLNFVSENKYCCQCGGLLESSYCNFPKWDWEFTLQCKNCGLFYVAGYRTDDELYF